MPGSKSDGVLRNPSAPDIPTAAQTVALWAFQKLYVDLPRFCFSLFAVMRTRPMLGTSRSTSMIAPFRYELRIKQREQRVADYGLRNSRQDVVHGSRSGKKNVSCFALGPLELGRAAAASNAAITILHCCMNFSH